MIHRQDSLEREIDEQRTQSKHPGAYNSTVKICSMLKLGRTKSQTLSTESLPPLLKIFFRVVCWMGLNLQSAKKILGI